MNQKGAVLITLIVSMVIMAFAASGMLYFSTTSSFCELLANRQERAYYVGEAGVNYAIQQYLLCKQTTCSADTSVGPFKDKTTFFLKGPDGQPNGDQFEVQTSYKYKESNHMLIIQSTGTVGSGWLTTRQLITKEIDKKLAVPPGMAPQQADSSGVPIGFDANATTQPNTTNPLDNTWTPVVIPQTSYTIVDGNLEFQGTEAVINLNPSNVNLCEAWASNGNDGNRLSYFLQVKIQNSSNPQHFLVGLSFRVKDNTATSDSYGFSLFRYDTSNNCPSSTDWCQNTYGVQQTLKGNNKVYAVLWKRVNNRYTVLAYAEMVSSYGVASNGDLSIWPTLLVRVTEKADGNYIKAYVKPPTVPATGYTDWLISNFKPVIWTYYTAPSTNTEIFDNTSLFLSSGFCTGTTQNRPEVGVHGFYDRSCNKCQFFDDFGASVMGTGGGGSQW